MNYRRALVIAMGVIAVFFLIIFLVSHFMQPILPHDVNSSVLLMVASLLGAMMLLAFLNNILNLVRKVFGNQDETKIERFERTFEDYLRAIKVYCKEFPYLSIDNLLEGERRSLSVIYIPLKARSKRDNPTLEDSIYGKLSSPRVTFLRTCRDWRRPGTSPSKTFQGKVTRTICRLTGRGREAFRTYREQLNAIIIDSPE